MAAPVVPEHEYLAGLQELRRQRGGVFPGRRGEILVADPAIAREVLGNRAGCFREDSDFFRTGRRTFGPRSAQVSVGRAARRLLSRQAQARAVELPGLVAQHLVPSSEWPDAGNRLLWYHMREALVGASPSAVLLDTVEAVIERAVLAGARDRWSRPARALFRARVVRILSAEIAARRPCVQSSPADLLDVVAQAATAGTSDRDLAEVYLSCLFAAVGSVGFLLGWSLYLLGTSGKQSGPMVPGWVVREALRLWPVAWMFSRRPARAQQLGTVAVTPADEVVVCSYLVHRDPRYWADPDGFHPSRWVSVAESEAFIPFGWGSHTCTAAGYSTGIVEALLRTIMSAYLLGVTAPDPRPQVAAALAPPRFTLQLGPGTARTEGR